MDAKPLLATQIVERLRLDVFTGGGSELEPTPTIAKKFGLLYFFLIQGEESGTQRSELEEYLAWILVMLVKGVGSPLVPETKQTRSFSFNNILYIICLL
jgi:hypothetical protein